jgi:hypothetical protein
MMNAPPIGMMNAPPTGINAPPTNLQYNSNIYQSHAPPLSVLTLFNNCFVTPSAFLSPIHFRNDIGDSLILMTIGANLTVIILNR